MTQQDQHAKLLQFPVELHNNTIIWDIDDVILTSSEAIISILNEIRLANGLPIKPAEELHSWGYREFFPISKQQLHEIFESDMFWSQVKISPTFKELIMHDNYKILRNYSHAFLTGGTTEALKTKFDFLFYDQWFNDCFACYKDAFVGVQHGVDKAKYDLHNAIQVDDNMNIISTTNARVKFILKNNRETDYNTDYTAKYANRTDMYFIDNHEQLRDSLIFMAENGFEI